jgi:hypothetical protein
MKTTVTLLSLIAGLLLFSFCAEKPVPNAAVAGEWKAAAWEVQGVPSPMDKDEVIFTFVLPDAYTASFGTQKEKGTYRVEVDKLYTTAEGQIEKMVGIRQPHPDTLILDMNRQGTQEALILVKSK